MEEEIEKISESFHDPDGFKYHIKPVVKNALMLAKKVGADVEIVEIAAYLHDIGRSKKIMDKYVAENEHHIIGAEQSKEILKNLGYGDEFIEKVAHCILAHRGRKGPLPETIEAEVIANADAMAHFDTFLDMFRYFLMETTGSFEEAVEVMSGKIDRNWNKKLTLLEARKIVKPKYEAALLLLDNMKEYI